MPDLIKLPSERVEQLRMLSKNLNTPIVELISEYIRGQIAAGNLTPSIPTIEVSRSGQQVEVDFGDFQRVLDVKLARAFATTLRWFAKPKGHGPVSDMTDIAQSFGGAQVVGISRRGTAIKIAGDNGAERTLAPSVARDLAEIIDKIAA